MRHPVFLPVAVDQSEGHKYWGGFSHDSPDALFVETLGYDATTANQLRTPDNFVRAVRSGW